MLTLDALILISRMHLLNIEPEGVLSQGFA
jgi:hypothetical protein